MMQRQNSRKEANESGIKAALLAEGRQTLHGKVLCFVERLERLGPKARENGLILAGHIETIEKNGVGPSSFKGLLMDATCYPFSVVGYYDPKTEILSYFSGARPTDKNLVKARFSIDLDKKSGYEVISAVEFMDGANNPHLRALVGMPVSIYPEKLLGK